jgi:hypothetical protein
MQTEHVIVSKNTFLNYDDGPKFATRRSQTVDLQAARNSNADPVYLVQELDKTPANYYQQKAEFPFNMEMKPGEMWHKQNSNCSTAVDSEFRTSTSSLMTPISRRISITSLRTIHRISNAMECLKRTRRT